MGEQKTIGQIAFEASIGDEIKTPYKVLAPLSKYNWEAAASAVWDKAVEECAQAIKEVEAELAAEGEVYILVKTVEALRSLKRLDKTDTDDVCQAKSSAQGETVSAPAEPLQATAGGDAERLLGEVYSLNVELPRFRRALTSISKNTCCGPCQEAAKVAMSALRGSTDFEPKERETSWQQLYQDAVLGRKTFRSMYRDMKTKFDRYGLALMMIREGCENPRDLAAETLAANSQSQIEEPANAGDEVSQHKKALPDTPSLKEQGEQGDA